MSAAKPMGAERRCASYGRSHPGQSFTPAQRRRLDRKARRNGELPVATFQMTQPKNKPTPRQPKRKPPAWRRLIAERGSAA